MGRVNVDVGIKAVSQTSTAFSKVRADLKGLNDANMTVGKTMKRQRRIVQQAGMQISDFAVQVGGGQSAILAFTQNAPQFVQSFGAIGGAIAAAISIGGVLLLVWKGQRDAAEAAKKSIMSLSEAYKSIGQATGDLIIKMEKLRFGVDTEAEVVALRERIRLQKELAERTEVANKALGSLSGSLAAKLVANTQKRLDANKAVLEKLKEQAEAHAKMVNIGKQMNAVELAHASIIGDKIKAAKTLAATQLEHAKQLRIAGMTQKMSVIDTSKAHAKALAIGKQMNAVELAHASIIGDKIKAAKTLVAATQLKHAKQLRIAGMTQKMSIDTNKAYAQQLRLMGMLIAKARTLTDIEKTRALALAQARLTPGVSSGRGVQGSGTKAGLTFSEWYRLHGGEDNSTGGGTDLVEQALEAYDSLRASMDPAIAAAQKYAKAENTIAAALRLGVIGRKEAASATEALIKWTESLTDRLMSAKDTVESLATSISSSIGDSLMSMVDGTKSVKDAFRDMARDIIAQLYDVLVVQRLVGNLANILGGTQGSGGGFLGKILPSLLGVPGKASGGPVSAGKTYMVGEDGPELFSPRRGGQITPSGQGSGGGGQVINVSYNFQGGVTQADLAHALPMLVEKTKRAMVDEVQRGGAIARTMRA